MNTIAKKPDETPSRQSGLITRIILLAVMTSLVFVVTTIATVPISALGQRFNGGDIMIFIAAWAFGPSIGGFAGGVGSAFSDALYPGPFPPFTMVIKGCEGYVAGFFVKKKGRGGLRLSWFLAGVAMVGGYFVTNAILIGLIFGADYQFNPGFVYALIEVPFDIAQVVAGGIIGRPVSEYLRRTLPPTLLPSTGRGIGPT